MVTTRELLTLLEFPSETLTIEYKDWLSITENTGKATLAKAAIALANGGGGVIVLGMRENNGLGGALESQPRPAVLARYGQDEINSAINRFADPEVHCDLRFAIHPQTNVEHAFVIVPGAMQVPVMSTRACEGIIAAQRCYVRKPGPRSEEPLTANEWHGVLERCLAARRESMLDAIRVIVQGRGAMAHAPIALELSRAENQDIRESEQGPRAQMAVPARAQDVLVNFERTSLNRWNELVSELPQNDDAKMPLGRYQISFQLLDVPPAASVGELRNRMWMASQVKHTGWGPFVQLSRAEFEPRVVNGCVEAWLGQPVGDRVWRDAAHCDYWRAQPSGLFFLLRAYDEDTIDGIPPGSIIDITLPIWRVGEALLYASRVARGFSDNPVIVFRAHYMGLRNRRLGAVESARRFFMDDSRICHDVEVRLNGRATAAELNDNLIEILHPLLLPLYERFRFFELPLELIRTEVGRMRSSRL